MAASNGAFSAPQQDSDAGAFGKDAKNANIAKPAKATQEPSETPKRDISEPPRNDKTDLFIQPKDFSAKRETIEQKNRMRFAGHFNFADPLTGLPNTFDPKGNYNCGSCNQETGGKCLLLAAIKGKGMFPVNEKAGSCEDYEIKCAGDPEYVLNEKPPDLANYGVAKNGVGFGCHRCPFASKALRPDSQGRTLYCGKGDFRTFWNACCSINGAPTVDDNGK